MGKAGPLCQESQTGTNLEDTRWPVLNLEHVPCIKRRLDIKAPSPIQGSSSSSESEDETTIHLMKQEKNNMNMAIPPSKVSQAGSHDPQTQWPALDLKQNTSVKRRLDIKAHSPASGSSSSSDSEDETTGHKERPVKVDITEPTFQDPQTQSHDRDNKWPALDLKQTMRIKRRLDIKAPSPTTGSSSSSDSEEDTTTHRKNQEKEHIIMARPPSKVSQTASHDPQPLWPTLDLKQTTRIKRRLDIKAPSLASDSSSSSDGEDQTTINIKKQGQEHINMARPESKVSEPVSHDPQPQWPALDLKQTTRIKRRLDIKAHYPASDSSSSSDSENETTVHTERLEKVDITGSKFQSSQPQSHDPDTKWPVVDLKPTMRIKRRLDIKAPSPPESSSSSSDSEDEPSIPIKIRGQEHIMIARPPSEESQSVSHDPQPQWPALDLKQTTSIKRRLDIKAPSPPESLSSSSDSDDETTIHPNKQDKKHIIMARLASKVSQTANHDPQPLWPALNLKQTMRIKRRLDIKAPAPTQGLSSNGDSENETTIHLEKQVQGHINLATPPSKVSQTVSRVPQPLWPTLDLKQTTRIKRRLDIKAPSLASDSSSSSDGEDQITINIKKQGQEHINMARPESKVSEPVSHDPQPQWPALDLKQTTRIKRRLDIKAPSPPESSSSSSDSEDEPSIPIKIRGQEHIMMARPPTEESQSVNHDPQPQWPALDLKQTTSIKRRLDIKAHYPASDSSSSSDSENETTVHTERLEKVDITGSKFQSSQTQSHDPDTKWPVVDLKPTMRIKRRLDIKAPSPPESSSSSSDSEDEPSIPIKIRGQEHIMIARPPSEESQSVSHDPQPQWPALDLKQTTSIKRRLDIKAPSPPESLSSSSDSDDETTIHPNKQDKKHIIMARLASKVSQTANHDPQPLWPALNLKQTMRIKRRLDIKAPAPTQGLSSNGDSENETTIHLEKQAQGHINLATPPSKVSQTVSRVPQPLWPTLDLKQTTRIKRRLDIKAPSLASDSSSSSDGEDQITINIKKQGQEHINMARPESKVSEPVSHDPQPQWPALDLKQTTSIKRRLDIKALYPASDSSSSSDSENETTVHTERLEKVDITGSKFQGSQTQSHDPDTKWPVVDLKPTMRIKRRLDIKAPSPPESSSSSSDSEDEPSIPIKIRGQEHKKMARPPSEESQSVNHDPQPQWPALDLDHIMRIKRRLDIKTSSNPSDSLSIHTRSSSEDECRDHTKMGLGVSAISKTTDNQLIISPKSPVINISRSPKTDYNIQLEKYTVITDDKGDKTKSANMSTTPAITPELESRWATMNLGISRFRKRLEISPHTHEPPNLSSLPPPDSPSSSSENGTWGKSSRTRRERKGAGVSQDQTSLHVAQAVNLKPVQPQSQTEEVQWTTRVELKSQIPKVEEASDSVRPHLSFPHVKRSLDIRVPLQTKSSSSSNSENEKIDASVPDLSLGVPRIKRRLNVKAPLPESSSSSENENEAIGSTANQSRLLSNISAMTDNDSLITYKRVIMKTSSPPGNSVSISGKEQTATKRVLSKSFEGVERKRIEQHKLISPVDLPPELRWTGVGRQLSDLTIPRRHLDVGSPQTVSEDNNERKGLSALKTMSSERRRWDTLDENVDKKASLDPLTQSRISSTSAVDRRAKDVLYDIPHYRRHAIGGIKALQGAPPPIPATPPPQYEPVGLTWRSPQSSKQQGFLGSRSHLESRNTDEFDSSNPNSQNLEVNVDSLNVNISEV
ncbi:hypothetical protein KUCAC02_023165 [Chaenocephalus aceratus]|uniref:Uncharacterized protein n=1 Tax=Chaenocephalus aceratus TaxID=36190 RepID=A0ACB9XR82_CHAAC|nr:hypothetical protein KUCAC02_023165 [Chaenocephalus aceratus]